MVKMQDLRSTTTDQLEKIIVDSKKEMMNLRFQLKYGTLTNSSRIRHVRRQVARAKTLIKESILANLKNAKGDK